jgi:hypothetical protein
VGGPGYTSGGMQRKRGDITGWRGNGILALKRNISYLAV